MCTYGLEQWAQSQSSFFYVNSWVTNVATAGVLLWSLAVRQSQGVSPLAGGFPKVFWAVVALFAWSAFSLAWTIMPEEAWSNWRGQSPYLIASIVIMPLLVRDLEDLKTAFPMTLLLGGVVLLLIVTTTRWEGRQIILSQGAAIGSVKGKYGSPLATASLAGWVSLIALLMNYRGAGRLWQLLRWPLIGLGLIIAFRSGSRGQLFAMCAAGLVFLPFSRRIRNIWGFVGAALGVALLLTLATLTFDYFAWGNRGGRWDADNMINTWQGSRLEMSMTLLRAWADAGPVAWLIGLGTSAAFDPNLCGFYPHLVMLEVLGELGLVGFALLWTATVLAFWSYARVHDRVKEDPVKRGLAAAMGALFLFEVILSFKQGSLLGSSFAFGYAVILGRLWASTARTPASVEAGAGGWPAGYEVGWAVSAPASPAGGAFGEARPGGAEYVAPFEGRGGY